MSIVGVVEGRPVNERRKLASWSILPHDDSNVVAPYHGSSAPSETEGLGAPKETQRFALLAPRLRVSMTL